MKRMLGVNVYEAAKERISWAFDNFEHIYISFSGGKDSTVMTHMVLDEAIKRNRRVGLLFIDWEIQYALTIEHVKKVFDLYKDNIIPFWVSLPLLTDNACSQFEPEWICWEHGKEDIWVRQPENISITDESKFPFYYYPMTFEEFVPKFGDWFGNGEPTACFVGIRTRESLNRWRALNNFRKNRFEDKMFTSMVSDSTYNIYPIYDWTAEDDFTYFGKFKKCYNTLYDRFYQAGLSLHQMRVDEPFGDTTRRSLWMYQIVEPETWAKMVLRASGANSGSLYSKEMGNILGNGKINLPPNHTWESFSKFLLSTMPKNVAEHYKDKIAVYIKWYMDRGYEDGIPDEGDYRLEQSGKIPSWRRICRTLLRNDYWCKGLGFSPTKKSAYNHYCELMKRRRKAWGIFNDFEN